MISIDIDLNISTPRGSVSIGHVDEQTICLSLSDSAALRDILRLYPTLQKMQTSQIGKKLQQSYAFDVQVEASSVMSIVDGKLTIHRRLYVLWQYLLFQFGL